MIENFEHKINLLRGRGLILVRTLSHKLSAEPRSLFCCQQRFVFCRIALLSRWISGMDRYILVCNISWSTWRYCVQARTRWEHSDAHFMRSLREMPYTKKKMYKKCQSLIDIECMCASAMPLWYSKTHLHQAKTGAKAKIVFVVCRFSFILFTFASTSVAVECE